MKVTASKLREDVYRILDRVLETGVPIEVERRGKLLQIVPVNAPSKIGNLKRRRYLRVDPEEIVHIDWSTEWRA